MPKKGAKLGATSVPAMIITEKALEAQVFDRTDHEPELPPRDAIATLGR